MYTLLDFTDQALADYLNSALRRHGLDSYVFNVGVDPHGQPMYSIACFKSSELPQARHLIYSSDVMLRDMHPEAAEQLLEIRRAAHGRIRQALLAVLTSKPALVLSAVGLVVAALGFVFGR